MRIRAYIKAIIEGHIHTNKDGRTTLHYSSKLDLCFLVDEGDLKQNKPKNILVWDRTEETNFVLSLCVFWPLI
jgi:hypothetical protein